MGRREFIEFCRRQDFGLAYGTQSGNIQLTDELLGRGGFRKVNVERYKGEKVAVKIIPFDFVDSDNEIELQKLGTSQSDPKLSPNLNL